MIGQTRVFLEEYGTLQYLGLEQLVVQCVKHGLMGTTSWGIGAEGDVNCGGPAQEIQRRRV